MLAGIAVIALAAAAASGCSVTRWSPQLLHPDSIADAPQTSTLKVHLVSGEVVLLTRWSENVQDRTLLGHGERYDARRSLIGSGYLTLPVDSVVLVETQVADKTTPGGSVLFGIYATVATLTTAYCVANPKACFGSCPTFYVEGGGDEAPQAEGFSGSVARALEERDIDALYHARPTGDRFEVVMRNEALETHAVRSLQLLAAPRPPGGRVVATRDGIFYPASRIQPPVSCQAEEGNCLQGVLSMDGSGWSSLTDPEDLDSREVVELEFAASAADRVGLVLGARHTFVSTHIFYQMLAYLGSDAGEWLVRLERGDLPVMPPLFDALQQLGTIHVSVQGERGEWRPAGTFDEAGPLATDVQVIPLPQATPGEPLRIRLELTRGFWRLDYVALAELLDPIEPVVLHPVDIRGGSVPDQLAHDTLLDPDRHLFTTPGDEYVIAFDLPDGLGELELFLASEGYYYEWMREEWLAEKDPVRAFTLLFQPARAFREMAGPFKNVEAEMERLFWESRFRRTPDVIP